MKLEEKLLKLRQCQHQYEELDLFCQTQTGEISSLRSKIQVIPRPTRARCIPVACAMTCTLQAAAGWQAILQCDLRGTASCFCAGLATSVCQVRRDAKELGLTESGTECSWFLLSFGGDRADITEWHMPQGCYLTRLRSLSGLSEWHVWSVPACTVEPLARVKGDGPGARHGTTGAVLR